MRLAGNLIALALCPLCFADRQIDIPTAHKIPLGSFRYELRYDALDSSLENYVGVGVTDSIEVEYRHTDFDVERPTDALDLTYNFISPITDFTPGFAIGVQDMFDRTGDGRRPFFVITFRDGFDVVGGEFPADFTLGISAAHGQAYPLVGAAIPMSREVRLLAEHDGLRLNAGFEVDPQSNLHLKWLQRGRQTLFGLEFSAKF